jgi:hypothetical protein
MTSEIRFGQRFRCEGENIRTYTVIGVCDISDTLYLRSEPGDVRVKAKKADIEQKIAEKTWIKLRKEV